MRATFNDRSKGERPIRRSNDALFPPNSVIWRVHGDVTSMMAGGIAALLLQMLHPQALGGVWDHSDVHEDMLGRLRRTARFIAVTTYGERDAAEAAIARVNYFAEAGEIARRLGADPVPATRAAAERLICDLRTALRADTRTREFRDLVLNASAPSLREAGVQKLLMSAAVDLLPPWARKLHGLRRLPLVAPSVRAATFGLASTLRWAFAHEAYR